MLCCCCGLCRCRCRLPSCRLLPLPLCQLSSLRSSPPSDFLRLIVVSAQVRTSSSSPLISAAATAANKAMAVASDECCAFLDGCPRRDHLEAMTTSPPTPPSPPPPSPPEMMSPSNVELISGRSLGIFRCSAQAGTIARVARRAADRNHILAGWLGRV